ncbi:MAG TPA: patatin-like phospholipase family protein [Thermoanaerobaculia bacterium]|nr:patatin-like phospholipase family protein [Thermoanaerobaculia bacterium]
MSSLPLELHQVLEEEYVSMYGPLPRGRVDYAAEDILDAVWARAVLHECGPEADVKSEPEAVAQFLSAIVTDDAAAEKNLEMLERSRALTPRGRHFIDHYDEYAKSLRDEGGDVAVRELRRAICDDALSGAVRTRSDQRLESIYQQIHKRGEKSPRTALCVSGGGIRSATFALGVMQGLASAGMLQKFDYLSTVSGGGYIGGWLSSWMRRHPEGASGVARDLREADTAIVARPKSVTPDGEVLPSVDKAPPAHKINPEPKPLRHLRAYSNYLSPRLGLFSGDTWAMASLYIRNLLLNLLVLVPLLAFVLAFPRMFSAVLEFSRDLDHRHVFQPSVWAYVAAGFAIAGFAYLGYKRPVAQGDRAQRKWRAVTTDGRFLAFCVLPLTLSGVSLAVFWARVQQHPGLLGEAAPQRAMWLALGGMTVIPYLLYYGRFWATLPAERRTSFSGSGRSAQLLKQACELFAALVAMGSAIALLTLIAKKVFAEPLRPVPVTDAVEPLLRVGMATLPQAQLYVCLAVPLILLVYFVQASIFVGISSLFNEDSDREWWGRAGGWLLLSAVFLAVFNLISVFGPIAFYYAPAIVASIGGVAGIASALLGFSDKTPANQKEKEDAGMTAKAGNAASVLVVPLFVVALLAGISLGTTWLIQEIDSNYLKDKIISADAFAEKSLYNAQYEVKQPITTPSGIVQATHKTAAVPVTSLEALRAAAHLQTVQTTNAGQCAAIALIALAALGLSRLIGVNKFSMHALYRNRLIRGYLGASRYNRDADRFTGFDENDNLQMWELRPEVLWAWSFIDVEGFVRAMKTRDTTFTKHLWDDCLHKKTRRKLETTLKIDGVALDALVQNLNEIIVNGSLATEFAVPDWCTTDDDKQIGYSRAIRNRAVLDANTAGWIKPMTPPLDAKDAPDPNFRRPPLHVVNTALNCTSGENLAWQQRMAESFTVSPYHSGSLFLGYRGSKEYGGDDGISLGTAVTISGAAASPNMGYHSSPTMAFLLTFFNIRLGAWLGNPGPDGRKSYMKGHPRSGIVQFFAELTGNSTDRSKWVYLSDGGHFENLGLYEMVLRRCHTIVLSDAGADPTYNFEDLGNAIRKIRTDLGVPIDISRIAEAPRGANGEPVDGRYLAVGKIRYSAVDKNGKDGTLIYIKPGIFKDPDVPVDVYNYAQQSRDFPHESTGDQFFSESQFESYRALGRHAVAQLFGGGDGAPWELAADPRLPIKRSDLKGLFGDSPVVPQLPAEPKLQLRPNDAARRRHPIG